MLRRSRRSVLDSHIGEKDATLGKRAWKSINWAHIVTSTADIGWNVSSSNSRRHLDIKLGEIPSSSATRFCVVSGLHDSSTASRLNAKLESSAFASHATSSIRINYLTGVPRNVANSCAPKQKAPLF